jgi:hypothetical protein
MAVVVQVDYAGVTLEQYDELVEILGLLPGGPPPRGVLFHSVMQIDGGIRIIDAWESPEALRQFHGSTIGPVLDKVGVTEPPEMTFLEVHNYFVGRRSH